MQGPPIDPIDGAEWRLAIRGRSLDPAAARDSILFDHDRFAQLREKALDIFVGPLASGPPVIASMGVWNRPGVAGHQPSKPVARSLRKDEVVEVRSLLHRVQVRSLERSVDLQATG